MLLKLPRRRAASCRQHPEQASALAPRLTPCGDRLEAMGSAWRGSLRTGGLSSQPDCSGTRRHMTWWAAGGSVAPQHLASRCHRQPGRLCRARLGANPDRGRGRRIGRALGRSLDLLPRWPAGPPNAQRAEARLVGNSDHTVPATRSDRLGKDDGRAAGSCRYRYRRRR